MSQLKRYNGTSWETVGGAIQKDTLPINAIVEYDGATVPEGYELVSNMNIVDAGNNWKKVDLGFARLYFRNDTIGATTYSGNGWGGFSGLNLPTGITFDGSKMVFSCSINPDDNAIKCNATAVNGKDYLYAGWTNKYGGNVTTTIRYSCILIDFS